MEIDLSDPPGRV
jgi:ribonuclease HI